MFFKNKLHIPLFNKGSSKYLNLFSAFLLQPCFGAIFIFSIYKPFLKEQFPNWSNTDLALPSQIVLVFFSLSMIFSGKLILKIKPNVQAFLSGLLLFVGMLVASFAQNLFIFTLGFGVIGGIGVGMGYVVPLTTCMRSFPEKKGMITGLILSFFGISGLIFTPIAKILIDDFGIMSAIRILGIIFFIVVSIGSLFVLPKLDSIILQYNSRSNDHNWKEMIKTKEFYLIWITYFIGLAATLMLIMNAANIWQSVDILNNCTNYLIIPNNIYNNIIIKGAEAVVFVSISNALGRLFWGKISDIIKRETTLIILFTYFGMVLFISTLSSSFPLFIFSFSSFGFCFGGLLSIYPTMTDDYFGSKNLGTNYGFVYTAYGLGGLLGPYLAPKLLSGIRTVSYETKDLSNNLINQSIEVGSYSTSFYLFAFLCFIAVILLFVLKKIRNKKD